MGRCPRSLCRARLPAARICSFGSGHSGLYSTGHRLGDLRRLIRQYGRGAETVFPTGVSFKGPVYGTDVNLPIPQEVENNGNFTACLDRGA